MIQARHVLLGACLALPVAAYAAHALAQSAAQPAPGGHVVYVPPGAVVLVVPGPQAVGFPGMALQPSDFPVAHMIAEQEASMQHMLADMNSLMLHAMPDPQQMIRSVMDGAGTGAAGSGVIMTSVSSGSGSCSETITYGAVGANGQKQVKVTRSGNACGAIGTSAPVGVVDAPPAVAPQPAPAPQTGPAQRGPRLWTISEPSHPVSRSTPPRT
jgi:hypothetical protein